MARVPYLDKSDLAPENQELLKRNITLHRALANSPNGLRAFGALGNFIRHKSRLDPRLRELAILQVGYLARAPYEWSHHVKIGRDFGVTDDDIRALIAETEGKSSKLEPLAKLVLKSAREMTNELAISEATYAALRQGPRPRAHGRSRHHHLLLQRGGAPAGQPADRRRAGVSALPRGVPAPRRRCGQTLMADPKKSVAVPRPAATVVILRDGREGLEVFMVVRHHEIDFASGALVFPGGKVDEADADPAWAELAPSSASALRPRLPGGVGARDLRGGGSHARPARRRRRHGRGRRCASAGRDLSRASRRR